MHFKSVSASSKFLPWLGAIVALTFLSGCDSVVLTNLTPNSLPDNPSEIYTFTLRVTPRSNAIPADSIAPHIVLDGKVFPMTPSAIGAGIYEFEYQLPPGRSDLAYYYLVDYGVEGNGTRASAQAYTGVLHATVVSRYVLSLEASRAPVGARVGVLGRGFTAQDTIYLDGSPARTVFESPTSLSFFVPSLPPGRNYAVTLGSAAGSSPVGTIHLDPTNVTVDPASLTLAPGGQQTLTFTLTSPAPAGGLLLDVTTDVPESVIMPDVVVPEGATSTTVTVQAGQPGSGSLFLKGYGDSGQITIPVTVAGGASPAKLGAPLGP